MGCHLTKGVVPSGKYYHKVCRNSHSGFSRCYLFGIEILLLVFSRCVETLVFPGCWHCGLVVTRDGMQYIFSRSVVGV